MAIREEADFLSENERKFLLESLLKANALRADGRELMQQRKLRVQFRRNQQQSQAEVQLGQTRVLANVSGEIVPPFPDRPTEGFLHFIVDLSPMASQSFEVGRPTPFAMELARIVDRGIRECRALDTEALAIVAGEKVWAISCDVHVLDHGGNLIDAISLASIAALMHYRRAEVQVQAAAPSSNSKDSNSSVFSLSDHNASPLSLHHIPISISFSFVQQPNGAADPVILMDPTDHEEKIMDGSITFTFNSFGELCAVHKIGGAPLSTNDVLRCAQLAAARVAELSEILKQEEAEADRVAIAKHRALLRGREFEEEVLHAPTSSKTLPKQQVDLGDMTNFNKLHAPIPLAQDLSETKQKHKATSMAQLLDSLEKAAGISEDQNESLTQAASFDLSREAREEFEKLTGRLSIRKLITEEATPLDTKLPEQQQQKLTQQKNTNQKKKKPVVDSDSEEETCSMVVESEFSKPKATTPASAASPAPTASKVTRKTPAKKVEESDDEDDSEEEDLSAAIKKRK